MNPKSEDLKWMNFAIKLANKAAHQGEVPIAALIVGPEGLICSAINTRERQQTPLGHAELFAIHKASQIRKNWRLEDCTLYVTVEPCVMCAGAIQQARMKRVVFGTPEPKTGGVTSLYQILTDPRLNHQVQVQAGFLEAECSALMQSFFQNRRAVKKQERNKIIYRERSTAIVFHKNKILGFHAVDPTSHTAYFFLPGGAVEPGETPAASATRECLEETGYQVRIDEKTAFERKYEFTWDGSTYNCKTTFYLGELDQKWSPPRPIQDADYHKGVEWIDIQLIPQVFGYHPDILWAVQKLLKTAKKKSVLR